MVGHRYTLAYKNMSVTLLLNITAFLGMYHKALLSAYNVCKRFDGCRHRMNYAKATQRTQRHTLRSWQSELLDSLELFKQSVVVQGIATGGRSVSACLHWVITAEEARPLVLDTDVVINLLKKRADTVQRFLELVGQRTAMLISPVVVAEVYAGAFPREHASI